MEREDLTKAISNPELMRRALTVLSKDPGPLELVCNATDTVYGRETTYYLYRRGQRYIIAAECGHIVPMEAVVLSLDRATRAISQGGNLPIGITVSCLAIVSSDEIDTYCASDYTITKEEVRPDGTRVGKKTLDAGGWYSLILGREVNDMEEVLQDMEAELHDGD